MLDIEIPHRGTRLSWYPQVWSRSPASGAQVEIEVTLRALAHPDCRRAIPIRFCRSAALVPYVWRRASPSSSTTKTASGTFQVIPMAPGSFYQLLSAVLRFLFGL